MQTALFYHGKVGLPGLHRPLLWSFGLWVWWGMCIPGTNALFTTGVSFPPGKEERKHIMLCRRRSLALHFPFIMKMPLCFLLLTI